MKYMRVLAMLLAAAILPSCAQPYHIPQAGQGTTVVTSSVPTVPMLLVYPVTAHPICFPLVSDYVGAESAHVDAINAYRMAHGVPSLAVDNFATAMARAQAFHMVLHNFASTVDPEGDDPVARYSLAGAWYSTLNEQAILAPDVNPDVVLKLIPVSFLLNTTANHLAVGVWQGSLAGTWTIVYDFTQR